MKHFILCAVAACASIVAAQDRSAFVRVSSLSGVTSSLHSLTLTTSVESVCCFEYLGSTYTINSVFATFLLDDNDDLLATGENQSGWRFHANTSGPGGIFGWHINPNQGLATGQIIHDFNGLTGTPEGYGYHVRVNELLPDGTNSAYVTIVPEPAGLAVLSLGFLALIRRKR